MLFGIWLVGCSKTLEGYKIETKWKIDSKIESMNSSDYVLENWNEIIDIMQKGKIEIDEATSFEDVETIYLRTIQEINWVLPIKETK